MYRFCKKWFVTCTALLIHVSVSAANTHSEEWRQAIQKSDVQTLQRLAPLVADVDDEAARGKTALMVAAAEGATGLVERLIDLGAAVDHRNHAEGTALMYAAQYGQLETAKLLIARGAAVGAKAMKGWTALMVAVLKGHQPVVELLLKNGADPNLQDMHGWTPLMRAIEKGDIALTRYLLRIEDVNVNIQSESDTTALHVAAVHGQIETVQLLLKRGARKDLRDKGGSTALMLAEQAQHRHITPLLQP